MRLLAVAAFVCALLVSSAASAEPFVLPPLEVENLITVNQPTGAGPSLNGTSTFDGVALLSISRTGGTFICTGSLLLSGRHILTAAHCADGMLSAQSQFLGTSSLSVSVVSADIYPGYTGNTTDPRDIAILTLSTEVFGFSRYDIYRSSDELGQVGTLVGYGQQGNGLTGRVDGTSGTRRQANNSIDRFWSDGSLAYDFDNYSPDNFGNPSGTTIDALGTCANVHQTGVPGEGMTAKGDSGGPMFLSGLIAGIHSWGGRGCGDIDTILNSSWGEYAGDARVSDYAAWIDSLAPPSETEPLDAQVPEPSTWMTMGVGLLGVGAVVRRRMPRR